MCNVRLVSALTRAMTPESHLVLISDSDQLPSVGARCVLRDVIASATVPTVRVTHTFRQEAGSRIISLARTISKGLIPRMESGQGVTFHPATTANEILRVAVEQVLSFVRNSGRSARDDI